MARKCGERGWIGEGDGATLLFSAESLVEEGRDVVVASVRQQPVS